MTLKISLIAGLLLTGCGQTVYRTQLEVYCPPIAHYSDRFNSQLADELESLPPDNKAIPQAMKNYIYLRDRVRLCNEEKDKIL